MLQTLTTAGQTLVDAAKAHPRLVVGGAVAAALLVAVMLDRAMGGGGIPLMGKPAGTPSLPPPSLPGGPLPKGTTKLTSYLADEFFVRLEQLAQYFRSKGAKITAEELMAVLYVESGGIHPDSINSIGCVGLNQICATLKGDPLSGLKSVGFHGTKDEYRALSAESQLDFVRAFFDKQGSIYPRIQSLSNLYLVNFSPAFLGQPDNFVMYRPEGITHTLSGKQVFFGPEYYNDNAGIDSNPKKGYIEVGDMARFVARNVGGVKWNELRMRLAQAGANA